MSVSTPDGLTVAADIVPEIVDALDVSERVRERALTLAERYGGLDPSGVSLQHAPASIAAGAVYAAALEYNEKQTRVAVAAASGRSVPTVQAAYHSISQHEGEGSDVGDESSSSKDDAGQTVSAEVVDVETVVEYRSGPNEKVHRPDPDADELRPACSVSDRHPGDYRAVELQAIASHRGFCLNSACFGGDRR